MVWRGSSIAASQPGSRFLQLFGLCGLSLAFPLLDTLALNPEFFVAHGSRPIDVVFATALVFAAAPATLWLGEQALGLLGSGARRAGHALLCGALVGLMVLVAARRAPGVLDVAALLAAGIGAVLAAVAFARFTGMRSFAALLGAFVPLYWAWFLLASPASEIVRPAYSELPEFTVRAPATPIIMLIFDELPLLSLLDANDQLDPVRAPHFAAFARNATWFRNATTVADQTALAVPAILSGRRVSGRTTPVFENHRESLFTLLAPTHEIRAFESTTRLCPEDICRHVVPPLSQRLRALLPDVFVIGLHVWLPEMLTRRIPRIDDRWAAFGGEALEISPAESFALFARGLRPGRRATFDYLHVLSPHGPWEHLPTGQRYGSREALRYSAGLVRARWSDRELADRALQRHVLEVGNVDRLFGDLLADLRTKGIYDSALIVVLSDHGVSFEPGELWRSVTEGNHVELMAIPWLIKAPGQKLGSVNDRNVETIDVLPTIADLLGIEIPWAIDGWSAIDPNAPERAEKTIDNWIYQKRLVFPDASRSKALARRIARVGAGASADRLFRIGPHPELLGTKVLDGQTDRSSPFEARLSEPHLFDAVDLAASFVPLHVTGAVHGPSELPPPVAIAVNGIVRAVTTPYFDRGRWMFSATLPPESLRQGRNRVEVLAVIHVSGETRLAPTQIRGPQTHSALETTKQSFGAK